MRRRIAITLAGFVIMLACTAFPDSTQLPPPRAADPTSLGTPLPPPYVAGILGTKTHWNPRVNGDAEMGYRITRNHEQNHRYKYHSFTQEMEPGITDLPLPQRIPQIARHLSLRDAIDLALRENPNVKISELQRVLDKFNLEASIHNTYAVQWSPFTVSNTIQNQAYPTWNATGGFQVTSSTGTIVSLQQTNNLLGGWGQTTLNLTQPLLQNFGYEFNHITYANALDNEMIARLNFKNSVINAVVSVITAYRSLVTSYNNLDAAKQSLKAQEEGVAQDKLKVNVGQMAPSDLVQAQANVESTRLNVVQQEQSLRQAYQSFLTSLGLRPDIKVIIDKKITVGHETVPSLQECTALGLKYNIAYLQALFNLNIAKRSLIQAENSRKWTFNLTTSSTLGSQRSGVGNPITENTPSQENPVLGFNLSIPFDNVTLKQNVVSAKISIQNDEMNLEQQKETLVSTVMVDWDTIRNNMQQIKIAKEALKLQEKTVQNAELKLKYGMSSVFEVNTLQTQLLTQQQQLISTEIAYLNSITSLYQFLGLTLHEWHIKLRY